MLKRLFRWLVRTTITIAVLFAIAVIVDYVSHRIHPDSVLVVTVDGPVVERGRAGLAGLLGSRQTPLNLVRRALSRASRDQRFVGLAVEVIDPQMGLAQAQELAQLIKAFAAHHKWTAAYIESAGEFGSGNLPYLVASAAQEVTMLPEGELNLLGVGIREVFVRGTLDWLGIKPNFGAIGRYKTAAAPFTNRDFTAAQREQDEALVGAIFDQIVAQVSDQRHLSAEAVRALIDEAPLAAATGLKARLVDRLEYEDQFVDRLKHRGGKSHPLVSYRSYVRPRILPEFGKKNRIAVIYADGAIQRGEGGFDPVLSPGVSSVGSTPMVKAFKRAREDDSVRAVVFRINSPGGSVIGSELIRRAVELTRKKKPVVVSMSSYAASGGYWVSAPANRIVAEPGTITGSIGVLGGKFNFAPAAAKLYIRTGAVTRGANATMFDSFTDFTPRQQKVFQERILGKTYRHFLKIVASGRSLTTDQVDKIAQGRVWTGRQALRLKLVDAVGGLERALSEARELAGIPAEQPVQAVELPAQPGLLESLLQGKLGTEAAWTEGPVVRVLRPLVTIVKSALGARGAFGAVYCPVVPVI